MPQISLNSTSITSVINMEANKLLARLGANSMACQQAVMIVNAPSTRDRQTDRRTFICNFWHQGTLTVRTERHGALMSEITNDDLTRSVTGCFTAVCNHMATVGVKGLKASQWPTCEACVLKVRCLTVRRLSAVLSTPQLDVAVAVDHVPPALPP